MANLELVINKFITQEISLSSKDISAAAKSRDWFLNRIQNEIDKKLLSGEKSPQLYTADPFVKFGSYFKGTKVKDVDEFDVLVVIDSNNGQFVKNGAVLGTGVGIADPCFKYDQSFSKSDGSGVSPVKLLNWLKDIVIGIVKPLGGDVPERNGQAITAVIKSQSLHIDLVPAGIFTYSNNGSSRFFYNIPDGTINNGWIVTSPKEDIELLNNLSKTKNGIKNIIRILKSIRNDYKFSISSFAIECSVIKYANNNPWKGTFENNLFCAIQDLASDLRNGQILDIWDYQTNLISNLENKIGIWYAQRLEKILDTMIKVLKERKHSVNPVF